MMVNNTAKACREFPNETANPLQVLITAYDAAISDLNEAKNWHQSSRMDEAYAKVRHAQDVITELLVGRTTSNAATSPEP